MKTLRSFIAFITIGLVAGCDSPGGSRHEQHQEANTESAKAGSITGGESFQASKPYDAAYDTALTFLKRKDWIIESTSKETGQIVTGYAITGGWHQTGTRVILTLIKESDAATTVKVAVTEQRRFKALQIEPWGDAVVNEERSKALANEIKALF